jgi:hypothetical protein
VFVYPFQGISLISQTEILATSISYFPAIDKAKSRHAVIDGNTNDWLIVEYGLLDNVTQVVPILSQSPTFGPRRPVNLT